MKANTAAFSISGLMLLAMASTANAQDFGVMQSGEIIKQGNTKIAVYPMFVQSDNGGGDDTGWVARLGHGFTDSFDAELKFASYDNVDYIGADAEFALNQGDALDVALTLGGSMGDADSRFGDNTRLDAILSLSSKVSPNLELGGSLDFTRVSLDDVPSGVRDSFNQVHVVPGIEYRISDTVDLLAEFGAGMNDDSEDYFAAGLAFYIQ